MYNIQSTMDLADLVGKVVVFGKGIQDWESFAEPGMKARVKKYIWDTRPDPTHKVWFDFSEFEAENDKYMQANYYDRYGEACLTAKEAGFYKSVDWFYFNNGPAPFSVRDEKTKELPWSVIEV